MSDTIVMANLGYFQLKARPGAWLLQLRKGRSRDIFQVLPFDADRADQSQRDPAFGRRIARNVQHLLKMESGLDQFPDPAAGSYYVEQLTGKYAEMAWFDCFTEALQRKAQGGPF